MRPYSAGPLSTARARWPSAFWTVPIHVASRNEPVHLTEVLRVVADARGQSEEHVARITTENAIRFFGLE